MSKRRSVISQFFSDVPELGGEDDQFGSLAGGGTSNHFGTQTSNAREGMQYKVHCDNCGTPNLITVNWQELIIVGSGMVPPGWKYENGRLFPNLGCANGNCGFICTVNITPDEASRHVNAAIQAQVINSDFVHQVRAQLGRR
jgi:hypothetical protein